MLMTQNLRVAQAASHRTVEVGVRLADIVKQRGNAQRGNEARLIRRWYAEEFQPAPPKAASFREHSLRSVIGVVQMLLKGHIVATERAPLREKVYRSAQEPTLRVGTNTPQPMRRLPPNPSRCTTSEASGCSPPRRTDQPSTRRPSITVSRLPRSDTVAFTSSLASCRASSSRKRRSAALLSIAPVVPRGI